MKLLSSKITDAIYDDFTNGGAMNKNLFWQAMNLIRYDSKRLEKLVSLKLADILKVLDDEEFTVSVFGTDTVDNKIAESIANNAIIDFKKQLTKELVSKFSS